MRPRFLRQKLFVLCWYPLIYLISFEVKMFFCSSTTKRQLPPSSEGVVLQWTLILSFRSLRLYSCTWRRDFGWSGSIPTPTLPMGYPVTAWPMSGLWHRGGSSPQRNFLAQPFTKHWRHWDSRSMINIVLHLICRHLASILSNVHSSVSL